MSILFTTHLSAERWGLVKWNYSTATAFCLQEGVHSFELFGHFLPERQENSIQEKNSWTTWLFDWKKWILAPSLASPNENNFKVVCYLPIVKQTQIQKLGNLLLEQNAWNRFSPQKGLCTGTMAHPVGISEPPVLRLGVLLPQPHPQRWMENWVVG